ncbi:Hypothetical protein LOCK908_1526 [Lacticaseibacillus rhamnosus LOCK908]|nr:Hypothetical protein LOCK908_1526 [Lacticaseibacillus rhamnosus LOCK908]
MYSLSMISPKEVANWQDIEHIINLHGSILACFGVRSYLDLV